MYAQFGLVLMVTHACNLRCTYCYTREKFNKTMPEATGRRAIERAVASMSPGGKLELSFFGGEPLLEAELIGRLIDFARQCCQAGGKIVYAWAIEGDCDASTITSNTFSMEWPPHSGQQKMFPEADRAGWFTLEQAEVK